MTTYGEELREPFVADFQNLVDMHTALEAGQGASASFAHGLGAALTDLCLDDPRRVALVYAGTEGYCLNDPEQQVAAGALLIHFKREELRRTDADYRSAQKAFKTEHLLTRHVRNMGTLVVAHRTEGGPSLRFRSVPGTDTVRRTLYQPDTVQGILTGVSPGARTITLAPLRRRWLAGTRVFYRVPIPNEGVVVDSVKHYKRR